jgi:hypothetical protein
MEELFRSGSIIQNRSSVNWPLAKALQRHGDAETGFKPQADLFPTGCDRAPSPPFISKITERIAEVTADHALDHGFDCFDTKRKGFIVLQDVAGAAKAVGDNVTSEELEQLMNLGRAAAAPAHPKPYTLNPTL